MYSMLPRDMFAIITASWIDFEVLRYKCGLRRPGIGTLH